jgi:hypothetical protein
MEDLTGLDGSHSVNAQRPAAQIVPSLDSDKLSDLRPHILQKVDLTGDQMEIELKPEYQVGLDASRKDDSILDQFNQSPMRRWFKKISGRLNRCHSTEIIQITHFCQRDKDNFIDGWIASYKRGDQIAGSALQLQGWLVGRDSQAVAIQILHGTDLIAEVPVNIPRPDVLKVVPCHSSACNFGYQITLDLRDLPSSSELVLYSIFQDGRRILTGSVRFCKYGF